jgi:hypothetical protein
VNAYRAGARLCFSISNRWVCLSPQEIYILGRDHTGLNDDDIQYIMVGAKAKAERPKRKANGPAAPKPTTAQSGLREFGDPLPGDDPDDAATDFGATNINAPTPVTSAEELRHAANVKNPRS